MERFKNYINGEWVAPKSGKYFKNINPANIEDVIGEFPESAQEDVNYAVASAKEAFAEWKKVPAPKRGDIIRKVGDIFARRKDEIAKIMTREMGKPVFETKGDLKGALRVMEAGETLGMDTVWYLQRMASLAIKAKNVSRAIYLLRRVLAIDPQNRNARDMLDAILK